MISRPDSHIQIPPTSPRLFRPKAWTFIAGGGAQVAAGDHSDIPGKPAHVHAPRRGARSARLLLVAALLTASAAGTLGAQPDNLLHIRQGPVRLTDLPNALSAPAFENTPHIITLDGPMDPARHAALEAAGVSLGGYLPTNSFIADVSKSTPARLHALHFVTRATPYRKEWKLDPDFLKPPAFKTQERRQLAAKHQLAAYIWLFKGQQTPRNELARLGAKINFEETIEGAVCLTATLPENQAQRLADLPQVQFAEQVPEYTPRSNSITRWVVQSDQPNLTPLYDHGITGVGQIIAIIDGGIAYDHCSFIDPANPITTTPGVYPLHRKIYAYNAAYSYDQHGTHCAGTAAGDAGATDNTRGVAYGAKLVFNQWPGIDTASHYAHYLLHYNQGARVHSNSWGTDSTRNYDTGCVGIDSFSYDHDDNLLVFAVTDGSLSDPAFRVTNPENAKNCLAVTASAEYPSENQRCAFGSSPVGGIGPTSDGRRKPEIEAPGQAIISSAGETGCNTASLTGTSMACPAVAGAATLVRQYFTDGFYPTGVATPANSMTPSGPLLKAMLVNSATDMTGIPGFPSDAEGWGRVLLMNSVYFGGTRKLLISDVRNAGGLQTGQSGHIDFWAENCNLPLKITMAYHDYPGPPNLDASIPVLVNNLDLIVTDPNGQTYYGNNFANAVSTPGGVPDTLNNLEQVLIANPQPGHWTVTISAAAVQSGPQGYAVVVTGAVDQNQCANADFNCDGDTGTDADIEAFFRALAGGPGDADVNRDGDVGTDADIEAFFRILAGQAC